MDLAFIYARRDAVKKTRKFNKEYKIKLFIGGA